MAKKTLRKINVKLATRTAAFEVARKTAGKYAQGFHKPGSMKPVK